MTEAPKKKYRGSSQGHLFLIVLALFFLSGMTGLIYEILWTRMITRIIGGAPFAISIVLTVFMAGLGLGSYLAGRKIDKIQQPGKLVRLYGILELVIGGYGLLLPLLLSLCAPAFALLYNQIFDVFMLYNVLTFVGLAVLLIIPVTCMGATLPILARFYVTRLSHLGSHTGRLYGLNTIGAAIGACLAGFWLLAQVGMWGTLAVAVALNVGIGLVAWVLGARATVTSQAPPSSKRQGKVRQPAEVPAVFSRSTAVGALVVFAVSGFCAMAYEVIWTKLLALLVGPTTYSFTIVLATFIIGLALGAMFFGWLADRYRCPVQILVITQLAAAVLALAVSQLFGNSQLFFTKLIFEFKDNFALQSLAKALTLFLAMLAPTLCLGATFPLVGKIYTASASRVGRSIGSAYAVNTIGAVLGSFAAGFLIIPALGKATGLSAVIGLQVIGVLVFLLIAVRSSRLRVVFWGTTAAIGIAALASCTQLPSWDRNLLAFGRYHRFETVGVNLSEIGWWSSLVGGAGILAEHDTGEVLYYGDGVGGTTAVLRENDIFGNEIRTMANSGKPEASNVGDMPTQTLLAHFPLLFHPAPKTVMVIGLASGVTAGEVLRYPIERLDVVEISSEVVKASHFFDEWNNGVLDDKRTQLIIQDGRAHLGMYTGRYDVVISEPSNPWMAGLAALFTRDFFEQVHSRLNDGGTFVQFLHSYQMDWEGFSLVGRAFTDVFANSLLVSRGPSANSMDFLLVGFKGERRLHLQVAMTNLQHAKASSNIDLVDARVMYAFIRTDDLGSLFTAGAMNTDASPQLEFLAPKLMFGSDPAIYANIEKNTAFTAATQQVKEDLANDVDLQLAVARFLFSVHMPFAEKVPPVIAWDAVSSEQVQDYRKLIQGYCEKYPVALPPFEFVDDSTARFCRQGMMNTLAERLASGDTSSQSCRLYGGLLRSEGHAAEAVRLYRERLAAAPEDKVIRMRLAGLYVEAGQLDSALAEYERILEYDPRYAAAHYNIGFIKDRVGDPVSALAHYEQAIDAHPEYVEAHYGMAVVLANAGRFDEAEDHLEIVLDLRPDLDEARSTLARIRQLKRQ